MRNTDLAIVGAGAAGLMAAITAGRAGPGRSVVLLDGAARIGAKILISGGGRCNVTHDVVDETAFAGSTPAAVRKVLRRFTVEQTVDFFRKLNVHLKRETTGKLFPTTDSARAVLDALLAATRDAGVALLVPRKVDHLERRDGAFRICGPWGELSATKVILATGGRSVPKTGSDGHGYELASNLGHSLTRVVPALVPLLLPRGHVLTALSGLSAAARVEVHTSAGKRVAEYTDSVLCTHFGLSGPAILDISRYYLASLQVDPGTRLQIHWTPATSDQELEAALSAPGPGTVQSRLRGMLPERLLRAFCNQSKVEPAAACARLTRESRRRLLRIITRMPLPITGSRGFDYAEVTAGGVPLRELHLNTMESRVCPGLYLCGEICDVDGRIGGYNFQWAWSSGYVAGASVLSQAYHCP